MTGQLTPLITEELDPLFKPPPLTGVLSAWYGHVPFAFWLMAALRPGCFVELGTHNGVSYAAFCEAVRENDIPARCYAVDTWKGDEHAGLYGEEVYRNLLRFHNQRYSGFSELLRCTFDEALPYIPDGTVDLLHIDGRHHYEDVLHDFTSWLPKLSPRAVVLFHDTNVRERDFGVFKLWQEVSQRYPSFEFLHGHGLGVLAVGPDMPDAIQALTGLNDPTAIAGLRARFALLGERWIDGQRTIEQSDRLAGFAGALHETKAWAQKAQNELDRIFPLYLAATESEKKARANLSQARYQIAALAAERREDVARYEASLAEERRAAAELNARVAVTQASLHKELLALNDYATHAGNEARRLDREVINMRASGSWRVTAGLRKLQSKLRRVPVPMAPGLDLPPVPRLELPDLVVDALPAPIPPQDLASAAAQAKKSILFIAGEPHTPGTIYRVSRAAELARMAGWDAATSDVALVNPEILAGHTAIVIWRAPWSVHLKGIVDHARENKMAVFYDVDDLMFRSDFATVEMIDGIRSQRFSAIETSGFFLSIYKAIELCDMVICPTEELAGQLRYLGFAAIVVANGFNDAAVALSRKSARQWREARDGLTRLGYAGGSRTHQRDFAQAADAVADVLEADKLRRLVLFKDPSSGEGLVLVEEFPRLAKLSGQIEWRNMVPLEELPQEIARFDVNLAPLEAGNPFCEAKSELKYFEAALAAVPTIASPTGPYRRAISDGVTGYLASTTEEWRNALQALLDDPARRAAMAQAAYHDSLRKFGPATRADQMAAVLAEAMGGNAAVQNFLRTLTPSTATMRLPHIPASDIVFATDRCEQAEITVIIPLYNYAQYVIEAVESVRAQTLPMLDLIVIDDGSSDDGMALVKLWMQANQSRFNRLLLLKHTENAGLGFTRNSGFAAAETPFVLPLDADNRLLPKACEKLLEKITAGNAAFVYPAIRSFGDEEKIIGTRAFSPHQLARGNYIDAMALIRKSAWAEAGGYDHVQLGWEDYDFWLGLIEHGRYGENLPDVLAEYRVHRHSMLRTATDIPGNRAKLAAELRRRHPWVRIEHS
jgi:glycosyltransferase involved in cell wall biosynthesis